MEKFWTRERLLDFIILMSYIIEGNGSEYQKSSAVISKFSAMIKLDWKKGGKYK